MRKCLLAVAHVLGAAVCTIVVYVMYLVALMATIGGDFRGAGANPMVTWTSEGGQVGCGIVRAWAFAGALVTVLVVMGMQMKKAAAETKS